MGVVYVIDRSKAKHAFNVNMASSFPLASSPSPLPSTSSSNTCGSFNESDTEGSTVTVSLEDDFEERTIKAVRVDYNKFFELPTQPNTNA